MSFTPYASRRYTYNHYHYLWTPGPQHGLRSEPIPGGIGVASGVTIDTSVPIKRLGIETQENVVAINVYEERVCDFDYPDGLAPNYYTQGVQRDYISAEYNPETHMNMFVRAEVLLQRAGQLPPRALGSLGILKIWEEQIGYTYALATQALIALSVPHPRQAPPVVE